MNNKMGISIEQWRCKIGCFRQTNTRKSRLNMLAVHMNTGLKSGLRVMICLAAILIMCGDVEQNPGPKSGSSNDGTSGASSGRPSSPQATANADSPRNVSLHFAFEYCCACYLELGRCLC